MKTTTNFTPTIGSLYSGDLHLYHLTKKAVQLEITVKLTTQSQTKKTRFLV
jgi:hypothetical protein